MRIDKFLKNSRIIKRRTVAKECCQKGRVFINEKQAKPGDEVKVGDILKVVFGAKTIKAEVLSTDNNVKKDKAKDQYRLL